MKRIFALLIALIICASSLISCSHEYSLETPKKTDDGSIETDGDVQEDTNTKENTDSTENTESHEGAETAVVQVENSYTFSNDVEYVLIYNPYLYDEDMYVNPKLYTGDISGQITVSLNRDDPLPSDYPFVSVSQGDFAKTYETPEVDLSLDRADFFAPIYEKGDTNVFYYGYPGIDRSFGTFKCAYSGEHCYVWSINGSVDEETAVEYGTEFDKVIYPEEAELFGTPRFDENGGKVSILFYPMPIEGILGFFYNPELFYDDEVPEGWAEENMVNTGHAIININSIYTQIPSAEEYFLPTIAHEYQHLICMSDTFYRNDFEMVSTWLNEAMSGYIEEHLYPGAKETEGHYYAFETSELVKSGQSLYNFTTSDDDIGVYGSVYLFTEYLVEIFGEDVFSDFHSGWRFFNGCDEANILKYVASKSNSIDINSTYTYPDDIKRQLGDKEWLSKLTLNFYMSVIESEVSDKITPTSLLYNEYNPADIEGGGRIIVNTKNNTFTIPEDADYGLIYVGLDENFKPVSEYLYK